MINFTFSIIYNPKPGFVIRIALILERRGYLINSLIVRENKDGNFSEMILNVTGEEKKCEQIKKQISKLIDVIIIEQTSDMVLSDMNTIF